MKKLLIVDDNEQNLYVLEQVLKTNGYIVDQASNGVEALRVAHISPPDMVISDILMPIMDGFNLCRNWMADDQLKRIPFVFYTATYTDTKDEMFAINLGAARFLIKPLSPEEVLVAINEVFEAYQSSGQGRPPEVSQPEEEYYKEYSEVLIGKLEEKMMQLELTNKRLTALYQASCNLVTSREPSELIHYLMHDIVDTAGYQQANYFQFNQSDNQLFLIDSVGFSEESLATYRDKFLSTLCEERGLVGQVARSGQLLNIKDTSLNPNWITLEPEVRSALFVPVKYKNGISGVIVLFSSEINAFHVEDEHNIAVLANNLAISIENIRIESELEQRVEDRTRELQEAQEKLVRQEKLAVLGQLAGGVGHELRNPLGIIKNAVYFLRLILPNQDIKVKEYFELIDSEIHIADKIINDLLNFSRTKLSEEEKVPVLDLLERVMERFPAPEGIRVIRKIPDHLPDLYVDPQQIIQVLGNLMINAYQAMPNGGDLTLLSAVSNNEISISVQDTGIGIPKENFNKLFEPLFTTKIKGIGLGLAVSKKVIESNGGRIEVQSEAGAGSTFTIYLPIKS